MRFALLATTCSVRRGSAKYTPPKKHTGDGPGGTISSMFWALGKASIIVPEMARAGYRELSRRNTVFCSCSIAQHPWRDQGICNQIVSTKSIPLVFCWSLHHPGQVPSGIFGRKCCELFERLGVDMDCVLAPHQSLECIDHYVANLNYLCRVHGLSISLCKLAVKKLDITVGNRVLLVHG